MPSFNKIHPELTASEQFITSNTKSHDFEWKYLWLMLMHGALGLNIRLIYALFCLSGISHRPQIKRLPPMALGKSSIFRNFIVSFSYIIYLAERDNPTHFITFENLVLRHSYNNIYIQLLVTMLTGIFNTMEHFIAC